MRRLYSHELNILLYEGFDYDYLDIKHKILFYRRPKFSRVFCHHFFLGGRDADSAVELGGSDSEAGFPSLALIVEVLTLARGRFAFRGLDWSSLFSSASESAEGLYARALLSRARFRPRMRRIVGVLK